LHKERERGKKIKIRSKANIENETFLEIGENENLKQVPALDQRMSVKSTPLSDRFLKQRCQMRFLHLYFKTHHYSHRYLFLAQQDLIVFKCNLTET
jgi:hypothetical protein